MSNMNKTGRCCEQISNYRNFYRNLKDTNVHVLRKIKVNHMLSNTVIISHIRNCSGHADFVDHLLSDSPADDTLDLVDRRYFLFLALILDEDFHNNPLYERLWSCIPILKRMMLPNLKTLWYNIDELDNILQGCSPMKHNLIVDFITCIDELKSCGGTVYGKDLMILKALTGGCSLKIHLTNEDIGRLIEYESDLPDCILDVYYNAVNLMRNKEKVLGYFREKWRLNLSNMSTALRLGIEHKFRPTHCLNNVVLILEFCQDDNPEPTMRIDAEGISYYEDLILEDKEQLIQRSKGTLYMEDFRSLLKSLCGTEIPMYLHNRPIFLENRSFAKSARKQM